MPANQGFVRGTSNDGGVDGIFLVIFHRVAGPVFYSWASIPVTRAAMVAMVALVSRGSSHHPEDSRRTLSISS